MRNYSIRFFESITVNREIMENVSTYILSVFFDYIYIKKKKNRTQTRSKWCTSLSEGETNTGNSLVVNHFAKTNCSILYEDCRKETRQVTFSNFYRRGAVL